MYANGSLGSSASTFCYVTQGGHRFRETLGYPRPARKAALLDLRALDFVICVAPPAYYDNCRRMPDELAVSARAGNNNEAEQQVA